MQSFCRNILERGDLATKLAPPPAELFAGAGAEPPSGARPPDRPARNPDLAMRGRVPRLPRPADLVDPEARAICLARFAHHELMAVELFAWALVRWPALSPRLRRGLLGVLADEQIHCRLYLERLAAHGARLQDHVLSDYFWKHVPAIAASSAGPAAFFAAVGLTFEQGNLDFSPLYRDAFRRAGDEESARVCERVHRDEIGHVRFAAAALRELSPATAGQPPATDVMLYERSVPFPLSAARAKGRRFDAGARREAGLSSAFIDYVQRARSPQELRDRARRPVAGAKPSGPDA
jgi:uncharacterized ferritin-like protein (DUF455 family)